MTSKYQYLLAVVLTLGLVSTAMAAGTSSSSKRPSAQPPSTYQQGVKAVKAKDYNRAIPLLQKVVARNPNHADALNYLAFSHRQLGHNDIALPLYKKVLAMNPDHKGANEYLGELYLKQGKLDLAKKQLAKLDKLCFFGCKEFDELKTAVNTFEAGGGFKGFSKQPQSAN
ncbi:MAG: tetratricopeptide repeat protein [Proteobacteria bacterium]|nr:tetratricopeptide repeat protein [Pseudomonadota bacterium]